MTRKCPKIQHINAVMDMARAALTVGASTSSATTRKRRKLDPDQHLQFSAGSSIVQINSRSPVKSLPETTILQPPAESEARCSSLQTDEFPDSCCSSNGSAEQDGESIGFLDLEVESAQVETSTCNCSGDERRDKNELRTRTKSEEMESAAENPKEKLITEVNSHRKFTGKKRPAEMELEEFFGAAEKEIQKQFAKKYNYDIVNDVPLEGRYEWVKLKP